MASAQARPAFAGFMADYTAFLAKMRNDEREKLSAVSGRDIEHIERCLAASQANAKQLENFEQKRFNMQAAAGYAGLSFRELIDAAPEPEQSGLWQLLNKFEHNVAEIRYFNDKSMAMARDNMIALDPSRVPQGKADNPYEKMREAQQRRSMMLERKA